MYYVRESASTLTIHDAATGAPHFNLSLPGPISSYNLNGTVLCLNFANGAVEVYDVERRCRIR